MGFLLRSLFFEGGGRGFGDGDDDEGGIVGG